MRKQMSVAVVLIIAGVYLAMLGASNFGDRSSHPNGLVYYERASGLPYAFQSDATQEATNGYMGGLAMWKGDTREYFEVEFCKWNTTRFHHKWVEIDEDNWLSRKWRKTPEYKEFGDYIAQLSQTCH